MKTNDSLIQSLATFVRELREDSLDLLLNELESKPRKFSVYFDRTKEDWEKFFGLAGKDIYVFLHKQEFSRATGNLSSVDQSSKILAAIQDLRQEFEQRKRHKSLTPGCLGETTLQYLERIDAFINFEDQEGKAAFWTSEDQALAAGFKDKTEFDVFITPFFAAILEKCGMVFVNSERYQWLFREWSGKSDLKPDGFATHSGMYLAKKEPEDQAYRTGNGDFSYLFGIPVDDLLDSIVIFERKMSSLRTESFGEVVKYLQNLPLSSAAILFNPHSFWLINSHDGVVLRVITAKWLQPGSRDLFANFFHKNNLVWVRLLQDACEKLNVKIDEGNGYLGSGAYGRVFRVKLKNGGCAALKIVLKKSIFVLNNEEKQLKGAQLTGIAVNVLAPCQILCDGEGSALLTSPVGKPISSESLYNYDFVSSLFGLLMNLHLKNCVHGDPRIENIIVADDGQLLWIDFMSLINFSVAPEILAKLDAEMLTKSILGIKRSEKIPDIIELKIGQYAASRSKDCMMELSKEVYEELGRKVI